MHPRRPILHDDSVTLNCTAHASECYPLCSVANCSAFPAPPSPPPPAPPAVDHHLPLRLLLTFCLLSGFLFLSLCLTTLLLYRRRRLLRRRRRTIPAPEVVGEGFDGEGGGEVHHVWYIRTVGLDEATIASIATVEYRGVGGGGCAVCLGEFHDGDRVRLLPRCAHAFHAPCIDTWLRAHVNCPLCRSRVAAASFSETDSEIAAGAEEMDGRDSSVDAREVFDEMSVPDSSTEMFESLSESQAEEASAAAEPDPGALQQPMRRSASMDSPLFLVVVPTAQDCTESNEKAPNCREVRRLKAEEKEGCASAGSSSGQVGRFGIGRSLSSSGRGFFFARTGRTRGSVLPL